MLEQLKKDLLRALSFIGIMIHNEDKLYNAAYSFIGVDASPADLAPDEYGCAESVSKVIQKAFPEINFPTLLSTRELSMYLIASPNFAPAADPEYGCVILSVTGTGNGKVANGHTGIFGKHTAPDGSPWIMSNDSRFGTWEVNLTLNAWNRYYRDKGGMAVHYFRPVAQ